MLRMRVIDSMNSMSSIYNSNDNSFSMEHSRVRVTSIMEGSNSSSNNNNLISSQVQ